MKPYPQEDLDHIFKFTENIIEEFRNKNIFIFGGTGFIGCNILKFLTYANEELKLNLTIDILSRNPEKFKNKFPHLSQKVNIIAGDIRNFEFPNKKYEYVIHGATDNDYGDPWELWDTIANGTRRVLDFAEKCECKKLLFLSSGAVYFENDSMNINSTYGIAKKLAEHLCKIKSEKSNLQIKIARIFCVLGPYLNLESHFAIGNFIKNCINNEDIIVKNKNTVRSYIYSSDLTVWLLNILINGNNEEAYDVGSDNNVNMETLSLLVKNICNQNLNIILNEEKEHVYLPKNLQKTKELGLNININLEEAIQKVYQWNKED